MQPWLEGLATYDVIYLGEEHHNRSHIDAALTVLRSLMSQGRRPWLAMEMFGWDGQPALARYLRSEESIRSEEGPLTLREQLADRPSAQQYAADVVVAQLGLERL